MATNPCDAGFLTQLWQGNAIICSQTFQQSQVADAVQQQTDTLNNVIQNYGNDSIQSQVATQATKAAIAATPGDVSSIDASIASSGIGNPLGNPDCSGVDLTIVGLGCIQSYYIWIAVAIVTLLLLTLFLGDIRAVLGR